MTTVWGTGLDGYTQAPALDDAGNVGWTDGPAESGDERVLAPMSRPFSLEGGLKLLDGNLGRAVIKVSAVKSGAPGGRGAGGRSSTRRTNCASAFEAGSLNRDFIAVIRFQGPRANGMPELHKLTPTLGLLQDRGHKVALLTDGRMSGASGKVPAAIHVTPEAADGGPIAKLREGDVIRLDAPRGRLHVHVDAGEFAARRPVTADLSANEFGLGRELFRMFRANAVPAELGAGVL